MSQFVYATGSTSPDYMVNGGVTYRIISDQLDSPPLVVNTTTGAITEQINYDEFGNVLVDSNAGFQPFGFAGGLKDPDTGLVRFGARDYNSSIGRWTAKDRSLFAGRDTNLYGYVLDDPINLSDPSGKGIGAWIVATSTSLFIDVGSAKVQGESVDSTSVVLDATPFPAGSSGAAVGLALDPERAKDICTGIQANRYQGQREGLSPVAGNAMQEVEGFH